MKFAHLADVHVGAWREPLLRSLVLKSFRKAVEDVISRKADFCIIAGDLFNSAMPAIDCLQEAVAILRKLKDENITVYVVPGSHDCSASGKSMIDVLEEAGLLFNVMKYEISDGVLTLRPVLDEKTRVLITGIGGRRSSLEMDEFEMLDKSVLESLPGQKVFVFHTSIDELKPEALQVMRSVPASSLPGGFTYYAGGHVHIVSRKDFAGRKNVSYPGPVFPASFQELWQLGCGGYYFFDNGHIEHVRLSLKNVVRIEIIAEGKSAEAVSEELKSKVEACSEVQGAIVLLMAGGTLETGKPSDIGFKANIEFLYEKGALIVLRSTARLASKEFFTDGLRLGSAEEVESELIEKYASSAQKTLGSIAFGRNLSSAVKGLLACLAEEQADGERKADYEKRLNSEALKLLGVAQP